MTIENRSPRPGERRRYAAKYFDLLTCRQVILMGMQFRSLTIQISLATVGVLIGCVIPMPFTNGVTVESTPRKSELPLTQSPALEMPSLEKLLGIDQDSPTDIDVLDIDPIYVQWRPRPPCEVLEKFGYITRWRIPLRLPSADEQQLAQKQTHSCN